MEKSWLGKIFSPAEKIKPTTTASNIDYADAEVQFGQGVKFASGVGTARDYVQAAEWYRKAAEQNHGLAQFNLGTMYAQGQGVARNDAQSVVWFDHAANAGDAGGQFNMGRCCQRASMAGRPADAPEARIEAYKWFQLAAAQGYKNAEGAFATLTIKMTHADVAEAIARVARFSVTKELQPLPG